MLKYALSFSILNLRREKFSLIVIKYISFACTSHINHCRNLIYIQTRKIIFSSRIRKSDTGMAYFCLTMF